MMCPGCSVGEGMAALMSSWLYFLWDLILSNGKSPKHADVCDSL